MLLESYPVLSTTIPAFKLFMTTWDDIAKRFDNLAHVVSSDSPKAVKYYKKMDDTKAYT